MRERIVVAIAALFVVGVSPAFAELPGTHFEISQLTGFTQFDETRNEITRRPLKDAVHFGVRLGYRWTPDLTVEAGIGFTPTQEDTIGGRSLDYTPLALNALWSPVRSSRVWPYVLAGAARVPLSRAPGGGQATRGNALFGLGARCWFNDVVGLRVETSDLMWLGRSPVTDVESHTWLLAAGLSFAFGSRPRESERPGQPGK